MKPALRVCNPLVAFGRARRDGVFTRGHVTELVSPEQRLSCIEPNGTEEVPLLPFTASTRHAHTDNRKTATGNPGASVPRYT